MSTTLKPPSTTGSSSVGAVLSAAALAVALAAALAWLAGWFMHMPSTTYRALAFIAALVVCGGLLDILLRRLREQELEAQRYLRRLAQADQAGGFLNGELPEIDRSSPWGEVLEQVGRSLISRSAQVAELEHSRAALELRARRSAEEHQRILSILDGLAEPVLAINTADELVVANPSARKLLGLDESCVGRRGWERRLPNERLVALLQETLRRKAAAYRSEEIELPLAEGGTRWHKAVAACIDSPAEGSAGVVAVLRDISIEKTARKQHAEFVSSASHEMKAPLAGIKAYVELLADGDVDDEETRAQFLEVISDQTERLQRLVENLLNLARIEAGVVKVAKESQGLNEILAEAISVVTPNASAKQIQLKSYLSPLYLGALVDRDMILQAAINLLSNAIKYTPAGGEVTLRSRMIDHDVQFEVQDTGVGLSETDCGRVFEKFYRVDANKQMASGTGLGLPLAKHIVEDVHSGKLTVESELGIGSTFRITIPGTGKS